MSASTTGTSAECAEGAAARPGDAGAVRHRPLRSASNSSRRASPSSPSPARSMRCSARRSRDHRAHADALDRRRDVRRPVHQGLLPGDRVRAHDRHHPQGRRAGRRRRSGAAHRHLPPLHLALFRDFRGRRCRVIPGRSGCSTPAWAGSPCSSALTARLPNERFVYLGDTARLPYGTKSAETVQAYALQATRLLLDEGVKMLVIACNTASAVALCLLQEAFTPLPVIGVIEPGARAGVAATANRRIAVIATEGTVRGGAYARAIRRLMSDAEVTQQPCRVFVALAEEGWSRYPRHAAPRPSTISVRCSRAPTRRIRSCSAAPISRCWRGHQGDDRPRRGGGRFGGDHGAAVAEALVAAGLASRAEASPAAPCGSSPPIRPSASPASARSFSGAASSRTRWTLVDLRAL